MSRLYPEGSIRIYIQDEASTEIFANYEIFKYSSGLGKQLNMSVFANKAKQLQSVELSVEQALCLTLFGMHHFYPMCPSLPHPHPTSHIHQPPNHLSFLVL